MKRIVCWIIIAMLCLPVAASAAEYELPEEQNFFFAGQKVSYFDYNGDMFVGLRDGKIIAGTDFQQLSYVDVTLPDMGVLARIGDEFIAVGQAGTLKSSDGLHWTLYENNLPDYSFGYSTRMMHNDTTMVVFSANDETREAGTYGTKDGIVWTKVEQIPEGGSMKLVNGKFVIESTAYMQGVYVSDDGIHYQRLDVPGNELTYYGGAYHTIEYIREDVGYHNLWTSEDLKQWAKTQVDYEFLYPTNAFFVTIDDKEYEYNLNGELLVLEDGIWKSTGERIGSYQSMNPPFVFYNMTDFGLLAWSTNYKAYYLPDLKTSQVNDFKRFHVFEMFTENDRFYAYTGWYMGEDGTVDMTVFSSADGMEWSLEPDVQYTYQAERNLKAQVNGVTLESEFDEKGSQAGRDIFPEITAKMTWPDGREESIVYEGAKGDCVSVHSGGDYFLLDVHMDRTYYSPDGITRYEFPYQYATSKAALSHQFNGVMRIAKAEDIRNLGWQPAIKVKLDGEYLSFKVPPIIEQDRTLVPLRFLLERAGAEVLWENESAIVRYGGKEIQIPIGSDTARVDGVAQKMDVPAKLIQDKTFIPLRFVAEQLGFQVSYLEEENTAVVTTN